MEILVPSSILNHVTRLGWVVNFTVWQLCLQGKRSQYPFVRRLVGPQGPSDSVESRKIISPTENRTPFRRPSTSWPSRYTETRRHGTCALFNGFQLHVHINRTGWRIHWEKNARRMESVNANVVKQKVLAWGFHGPGYQYRDGLHLARLDGITP